MENYQNHWDAVIVNYNGGVFLDPCLRSLTRVRRPPSRIIVVDNGSTDDSLNELMAWPQAEIVQSARNLGFAGGANLGVRTSNAEIVVVLNPDVEIDPEFGVGLIGIFSDAPDLGAAGARLRYPVGGTLQHAGGRVHWPDLTTSHFGEGEPDDGRYDVPSEVDYVTGAVMAVQRAAFDAIDGFDERYFPAYWEDVDFCRRLRIAGWKVRYEPALTAIHHEGSGQLRESDYFLNWTRNRLRFAMNHLTPVQWRSEFIPAEIDRLRGEVSALESPEWFTRSGGASIELLARHGEFDRDDASQIARSEPLLDAISTSRELIALSDPQPRALTPADGVLRRVKRFLARFSGRLYAEELYWSQRLFNESVVRAFEAQDRLNREQTVQLMLAMLLIGQQRAVPGPPESGPGNQGYLDVDSGS